MKIEPRNTTGKIQATMHQEKGLLMRRNGETHFINYYQSTPPGETQIAMTEIVELSDIDPSLLCVSNYRKSTVILCAKCGEMTMRIDSEDNQCRECFIGIDRETERFQLSIDRFAASRSHSQFYSAGDSLGRFH